MEELGISINAQEPKAPEGGESEVSAPEGGMEEIPAPPEPDPTNVYEPITDFAPPRAYQPNDYRAEAERIVKDGQSFTDNSLRQDPYFMQAATVYAMKDNPDGWEQMTHEERSTAFLTRLNRDQYNITRAIATAVEMDSATPEQLAAMHYGLEAYEAKEWSGAGVAGAVWGLASDPFTLGSIMSLGTGTVAREGAKRGAFALIKDSMLKRGNLMAADAALWTGVSDASIQGMDVMSGREDEFSGARMATSMAVGALAGKGMYHGGKYAGEQIGKAVDAIQKGAE